MEDRRLLAAGSLDPTFDGDGRVLTDFPSSNGPGNDFGRSVAVQQADGKIVVAGNSFDPLGDDGAGVGLVRYNANGSLDSTFGSSGRVQDSFPGLGDVTGMALDSAGKIVVAGYTNSDITGTDFFLARYNTDGTRDSSFDGDGWVTTDFAGFDDTAFAVTIHADGMIVLAGSSDPDGTATDFALARYHTDGMLDAGFGTGGKVTTDFGSAQDVAHSVAVSADGKIVAAGHSVQGGTGVEFALARYNTDGTLDASFGASGKVITDFGGANDTAQGIAAQPDGSIVVAGFSNQGATGNDFALARYNTDGTLDLGFGSGGKVTTDFASPNDAAFSVAVQADGMIVAAGYSDQGATGFDFALARYDASGGADNGFDVDGRVTTDFGSATDLGQSVALQADGKIVVAGHSRQSATLSDFAVARYSSGVESGDGLPPDTCDPSKTQLVVNGTPGDDKIKIHPAASGGAVEVILNGTSLGTFSPTGRIIVFAQAGDDDVQVSGNVTNSVWIYGGTGNDRLNGGGGHDVLLGEEGNDLLAGGNGRDLLIGGVGSDRIVGNPDDDILIAGATDHDAAEAALCHIMEEWTRTDADFATRVSHLKGPTGGGSAGGNNGTSYLNDQTVHDDGCQDVLTGTSGNDWFLFNQDGDGDPAKKDKVTDMSTFEAMFASDIDFINAAC